MKKFKRWYRRKNFLRAYRILKREAARHAKAGHLIEFSAVNESYIMLRCTGCPNIQPDYRKVNR